MKKPKTNNELSLLIDQLIELLRHIEKLSCAWIQVNKDAP